MRCTFISYYNYGLKKIKALYYSLGVVLILEGIFSALYHICPSKLNFQFDTTFMFVGTALMILTLYNKRHPDDLPSADLLIVKDVLQHLSHMDIHKFIT